MGLKERISKISQYFRGIDYEGGLLIVKVQYPPKLEATIPPNTNIKVTYQEQDNTWYYYGDSELIEVETVFDIIEQTVEIYEEAKAKVVLMRTKMEELKNIFANHSLDELERLDFAFREPTSVSNDKPKRKYNRKKKDDCEANKEETVEVEEIEYKESEV